MRFFIFFLKVILVLNFSIVFAQTPDEKSAPDKQKILSIMAAQEKAWNRGELESFMAAYWQSDELAFVGKSGIKLGWQTTLDNYKKSYPDKSAMGQLTFTILKIEIQEMSAFVLGQWSLKRTEDNPNGYFTLYWKKLNGEWKIVIDHSS